MLLTLLVRDVVESLYEGYLRPLVQIGSAKPADESGREDQTR